MMIRKLLIAGAVSSGLVISAAGAAVAATSHSTARPATHVRVAAAHVRSATHARTAADPGGENAGEQEGTGNEDGPGGWSDPNGQNVDHQFTGVE